MKCIKHLKFTLMQKPKWPFGMKDLYSNLLINIYWIKVFNETHLRNFNKHKQKYLSTFFILYFDCFKSLTKFDH